MTMETDVHQMSMHTIPTPEEIAVMAKGLPGFIGGRKDGTMFCQIRELDEGYAFRPYNSESDSDWQWVRTDDFNRLFAAFEIVNYEQITEVLTMMNDDNGRLRSYLRRACRMMGKKRRQRFIRKTMDT